MTMFLSILTLLLALFSHSTAQSYTGPEDPRLTTALTFEHPVNAISTTPEGRLFILYARVDGSTGPQVAEYDLSKNTTTPYPDAEWNNFTLNVSDPSAHLVRTNSQRIGPDGNLWLVDTGSPDFTSPVILPSGPKLVVVNITTNKVSRIYPMGSVTHSASLLDDIRFNPSSSFAYLTDAGTPPALIILHLPSGRTTRVLDSHPSVTGFFPHSAEGSLLRFYPSGTPLYVHADQLELSPTPPHYLYYQPAPGGLSRIPASSLDHAFSNSTFALDPSPQGLAAQIEPFAHTSATTGSAIDSHGRLYTADVDSQRIITIDPENGTMSTLVQDPRLLWVDAMWIDTAGKLWMPAAQLNRGKDFGDGDLGRIQRPLKVFTMQLGEGRGPSPVDHR
ncbi:MAG: hypothetical protein Q9227_006935 [Pyrenula ochraceoflavens]